MLVKLRNIFFTGLFVLLPVILTAVILIWGFQQADAILGRFLVSFGIKIPGIGLVALLVLIMLAGITAHNYIGRKFINIGESVLNRIPVFKDIYSTIKPITSILSNADQSAFRKVVLVEYPRKGVYSPGFFTGDTPHEVEVKLGRKLANVFIPNVPNPTIGFMIYVPEEELVFLEMSVEEAFKLLISVGVIRPEYPRNCDEA